MIEHSNRHYCLLIDGLDEIENSRELLLNTVLSISARSDKSKSAAPVAQRTHSRVASNSIQIYDFRIITGMISRKTAKGDSKGLTQRSSRTRLRTAQKGSFFGPTLSPRT